MKLESIFCCSLFTDVRLKVIRRYLNLMKVEAKKVR